MPTGIAAVLLLVPTLLQACPQCFETADNQVLYAYYLSALFMILIPVGIVGSILAWLFVQNRRADVPEIKQDARYYEAGSMPSQEVPA